MQLQGRGNVRPPIGVAFEGDLGHRVDAVLAVALLQGLATRGASRNVALAVSRCSVKTAQLADIISGFYTPRAVGAFATVGMPEGPAAPTDNAPLAAILDRRNAEGATIYTSNIKRLLDTADNAVLLRNVLLAQHDQNGAIVVAGPLSGLARLQALYGAKPQIAAKAKHLVVAAGAFGGAADASITADLAAARRVFAEWPGPIVVAGQEVGEAFPFPGASLEKDFAWAPTHPVVDAVQDGEGDACTTRRRLRLPPPSTPCSQTPDTSDYRSPARSACKTTVGWCWRPRPTASTDISSRIRLPRRG